MGINVDALRIKLVENEASWSEDPKDRDLATALNQQLEDLRQLLRTKARSRTGTIRLRRSFGLKSA